jgi:hypothetical protein
MVLTGDGRLIVFGGYYNPPDESCDQSYCLLANNTMFVYNIALGSWEVYTGSNGEQTRMYHAAVWVNGAMWVLGGTVDGGSSVPTLDIFRFNHITLEYLI